MLDKTYSIIKRIS